MNKFSWKTTGGGIAAFLIGLGMLGKVLNDFLLGEPVSFEQFSLAVGMIGSGVAGIAARDNNLSSEDVGVK